MHEFFHVVVLASTLLAAGGLVVLLLTPLGFEEYPEGLRRARPVILGLIAAAALLLVVEWLFVH